MDVNPDTIHIIKLNEAYVKVKSHPGIMQEISDHFTFEVPGARFMAKYRAKIWDGKIRLLDKRTGMIFAGLIPQIQEFAKTRSYNVIGTGLPEVKKDEVSLISKVMQLIKLLELQAQGVSIEPRDYQIDAVVKAILNDRMILLSPTASGKSLIIYLLIRWYLQVKKIEGKILIVVPTTSLVEQMFTDFEDYASKEGWNVSKNCQKVYSGKEKIITKNVIISTWQSIYKFPKEWFDHFKVVFGDEAHGFQAKSLTDIMGKMENCPYRFGLSGTIQDAKVHMLQLQGLFGTIYKVTTTKALMDKNEISDLLVKAVMLNYDPETCKELKELSYAEEIEWLVSHKPRNVFIKNLAISLNKGNTLVLYKFIEHGKLLYEMIKKSSNDRKVFYIYGGTEVTQREQARAIMEEENDAIIVASFGTFSTGINIRRLHYTIYASPLKSAIKNRQSIGRGLRKGEGKQISVVYDIGDNLSHKTHKNFALKHFLYRMNIYKDEQFTVKMYNYPI